MKKFITVFLVFSILFSVVTVPVFAEEVISDEPVPVTDSEVIVDVLKTYFNDIGVVFNDFVDDNYYLELYTDYTLNNLNFIYQKGTDIMFYLPSKFYNYLLTLKNYNPNCLIFYTSYTSTNTISGGSIGGVGDYVLPNTTMTGTLIDYDHYSVTLDTWTNPLSLMFYDKSTISRISHYPNSVSIYEVFNRYESFYIYSDVYSWSDDSYIGTSKYQIASKYNCVSINDLKVGIDNQINDLPVDNDYNNYVNTLTTPYVAPNGSTYYNYTTYNKPIVTAPLNPSPIVPPSYVPDISYTVDAFDYCKYTASQVYEVVHDDWSDEDYQNAYDQAYLDCTTNSENISADFENGALDTVFGILTLPYYLGKGLVDLILSYDDVPKCLYLPSVEYQGVNMSNDLEFCFDTVLNEPKVSDFYLLYLNFVDVILYFGLATLFYRKVRAMLANTTAD